MSVSGVSGTNNAVPLFDPGQASASQTNAGPANKNDNDNDNDTNDSAKVTAKAPTAPGTGKLVDKTV